MDNLTGSILKFIASASVVVISGIFLVRATDSIATSTKIGRLFAGSIFLAGATSLPELLVDVSAIRKGMPDLAVGDLLGSSLFNLLILALVDLAHKKPEKMFSRASAQHALSAAMSINLTALAVISIFLSPYLASLGIGGAGIGPLAIGITYVLGVRLVFYDQRTQLQELTETSTNKNTGNLRNAISVYIASGLAILITAPYLAESAGMIADATGAGKTFIGSTLVALCTSLPELVSTITAVRMGAFDLAIGNIFGSNSFNMLILLPLDCFHEGSLLASISRSHVLTGLATILATSVAVIGQLYQVERRKKFIEPDVFAVIVIVLGALYLLFWINTGH